LVSATVRQAVPEWGKRAEEAVRHWTGVGGWGYRVGWGVEVRIGWGRAPEDLLGAVFWEDPEGQAC
jgi:hypothetical protein